MSSENTKTPQETAYRNMPFEKNLRLLLSLQRQT